MIGDESKCLGGGGAVAMKGLDTKLLRLFTMVMVVVVMADLGANEPESRSTQTAKLRRICQEPVSRKHHHPLLLILLLFHPFLMTTMMMMVMVMMAEIILVHWRYWSLIRRLGRMIHW